MCVYPGVCVCGTHAPGHEVREAPVVLLVEEEVADSAAERLLIILIVDDLQHGLSVARPGPSRGTHLHVTPGNYFSMACAWHDKDLAGGHIYPSHQGDTFKCYTTHKS